MRAYGHGADCQLGFAVEEFTDALYLVVERAALLGGEWVEGLHGDLDLPTGAALMPHASDCAVDQQHRKVASLAARQSTFGGPTGEEQLARVAADCVGVEVGQQPYTVG